MTTTADDRQNSLFVMAQYFGRIGAMVNGKAPYDAKAAIENAEIVNTMARLPCISSPVRAGRGRRRRSRSVP